MSKQWKRYAKQQQDGWWSVGRKAHWPDDKAIDNMQKRIQATDAKIDKLLYGLQEFPPLQDALKKRTGVTQGGGGGGGKGNGDGWYCAVQGCGTHHVNPTCTKCRICQAPRLAEDVTPKGNGEAKGKANGKQGKGTGKGKGGSSTDTWGAQSPPAPKGTQPHQEIMTYLNTEWSIKAKEPDADSDGFPEQWEEEEANMDDDISGLDTATPTNAEKEVKDKEQAELKKAIAQLEGLPQSEIIDKIIADKKKEVLQPAPVDLATLSSTAIADRKAKLLTMEAQATRVHAAKKQKQKNLVEEATKRLERAQENLSKQLKAQQELWEEEQEFLRKMAEIRAAHLIGDDDQKTAEEAVRKEQAPQGITASQAGMFLEEAMRDAEPSQQMLDHGIPLELVQSVVKDFVKQTLERKAASMPTQHVPATA